MDYKKLGLKVGLELHRQLDFNKLFCNCPSILREEKPDLIIKRYLRPVLSEKEERDEVAEFEKAKGKHCFYESYSNTTCGVELDEVPPFSINKEALNAALQVALIFNMKIPYELQVMRKQVLDYSNTSGFQRTLLVAREGSINLNNKNIRIQGLFLEEDAARKIKEDKESVIFRLDRLGIPLIEVATYPDIETPQEAKDVAQHIGLVLKAVKAKSGIGTIRQDINVSIDGGARVEIKGVQDLKSIPTLVENEVKRQLELIEKGKKVNSEVRNAEEDNTTTYLRPMPGASRLYVETDIPTIKPNLDKIKLPELITDKIIKIEELGISTELAGEIVEENIDIKSYINKFKNIKPKFIAHILVEVPKEIKTRYKIEKIKKEYFDEVLNYLNQGKITKEAVIPSFLELIENKKITINEAPSEKQIEFEIKKIVNEKPELSVNALMGILMQEYKGIVDGKKLVELIKKHKSGL